MLYESNHNGIETKHQMLLAPLNYQYESNHNGIETPQQRTHYQDYIV